MNDKDSVIYLARLHWIIFIWPLIFLFFAFVFALYLPTFLMISLLFTAFSLIWLLVTWVTYQYTSLTIKQQQLILRTGFFVRYTTDVPFSKIESIDIRQSITGSLLNYGTLLITGTGGTRYQIARLAAPLTCRRYIEQWMQTLEAPNH